MTCLFIFLSLFFEQVHLKGDTFLPKFISKCLYYEGWLKPWLVSLYFDLHQVLLFFISFILRDIQVTWGWWQPSPNNLLPSVLPCFIKCVNNLAIQGCKWIKRNGNKLVLLHRDFKSNDQHFYSPAYVKPINLMLILTS